MQRSKDREGELRVPDCRGLFAAVSGHSLVLSCDDPTYTIVAANPAYAQALRRPDDLLGRGLFQVFGENPDLRTSLREVATAKTECRTNARTADGKAWTMAHSPLLDENGEVRFIIHRAEAAVPAQPLDAEDVAARYGLAFARAPIGMVLLTPEDRIIEVNQAYVDTLGYPREELLARDSSFFTHPEDIEKTRQFFASLVNGSQDIASIEKRYLRKDGKILWARATANLRRDDLGRPREVIAIVEDITERKRAREQLWASQAQVQAIYDGTYEYIGLLSTDGILLDCNRASLEFAGNKREDVIGKPFWETPWFTLTPGASEAVREGIAQAARGHFVRYEAPLRRPSGAVITFDFSLHPVRNEHGEVIFLVPEGRDITEQNKAAQLVEDDRRRWRELLNQTPAGIALLRGPEHCFDWVNPAYERISGQSGDALIGKTMKEAIPEVDRRQYVDLLDGVYSTGQPFIAHEAPLRLTRGDGGSMDRYFNFIYLPTRDRQGRIDGVFVHVMDVTDTVQSRRRIEESERQFRTLAETIPHLAWMADEAGNRFWYNRRWYDYTGSTFDEVKAWGWTKVHDPQVLPEVTRCWHEALSSGEPLEMINPVRGADGCFREFLTRVEPVKNLDGRVVRWFGTNTDITAQRQIEEKLRRMNRELEEFAYVASHDLQEPMRMVNIYTQMILRNPEGEKRTLMEYAGFVDEGVKRMNALIRDLLTYSRNVHNDEQAVGTADLSAAFQEALSTLKAPIEDVGVVINASVLPRVRGETQQLVHVFQNILSNALRYRKPETPLEVQVTAEKHPTHWIIRIRDNGIGFDPRYAERIFGLFKRLHKEEYPGTGLGLAICKRIIERYGGGMWAESKPGEGASFYFSLPCVTEP
jgi:PAS domain S-box-containing protein